MRYDITESAISSEKRSNHPGKQYVFRTSVCDHRELIAFHEAVQAYETDKGNFYSFAGLVIKRRLTDYLRSEIRFNREMSMDPASVLIR